MGKCIFFVGGRINSLPWCFCAVHNPFPPNIYISTSLYYTIRYFFLHISELRGHLIFLINCQLLINIDLCFPVIHSFIHLCSFVFFWINKFHQSFTNAAFRGAFPWKPIMPVGWLWILTFFPLLATKACFKERGTQEVPWGTGPGWAACQGGRKEGVPPV